MNEYQAAQKTRLAQLKEKGESLSPAEKKEHETEFKRAQKLLEDRRNFGKIVLNP